VRRELRYWLQRGTRRGYRRRRLRRIVGYWAFVPYGLLRGGAYGAEAMGRILGGR